MNRCSARHPLCRVRGQATLFSFLALLFLSITMGFRGLNWGIDFNGGVNIEIRTSLSVSAVREIIGDVASSVQGQDTTKDGDSHITIKSDFESLSTIKDRLGNDVDYDKIETVGPQLGNATFRIFLIAVCGMLFATWATIAFFYGNEYAIVGAVGVIHNVMWLFGLYSLFGFEVNEMFFGNILFVIAYSINDTVVIFQAIKDRLSAGRGNASNQEIIWDAIVTTLTRTILTSWTTVVALVPICLCGAQLFCMAFPIIAGVIVGTYTSICLVAPYLAFSDLE